MSKAFGRLWVMSVAITHSEVPVLPQFWRWHKCDATRQGWAVRCWGQGAIPGCYHGLFPAHSRFALLWGLLLKQNGLGDKMEKLAITYSQINPKNIWLLFLSL